MLPIRNEVLALDRIAEMWSKELNQMRTPADIYAELLIAFWRGELQVKIEGGKDLDRRGFLKGISSKREHPAFLFVSSKREQKIPFTKHQDGSVTIDSRTRILLPANKKRWTKYLLEAAYEALSRIDPAGFDQSVIPALAGLATSRGDFAAFCEDAGYPLPQFWFSKRTSAKWTMGKERAVERWLSAEAKGPKRKDKAGYFSEAQKRFPDLPQKAFNRVWEEVVPPGWRRPGPVRSRRFKLPM